MGAISGAGRASSLKHIVAALQRMTAAGTKRTFYACRRMSVLGGIVLQKSPSRLCEIEICNNRIGASVLLNRCCSFVPDLESMFRDQMPKILLPHGGNSGIVQH